jgi:SAM-dependent methyltransferase
MFNTYAEIFRERAAEYHSAMTRCPRARDAEFASVLEPLEGKARGLLCDMPSGGGYLQSYLPPHLSYIAIEPASDFFTEPAEGLQRLTAEITNVPLPDGSVDYIVSLAGVHHEPRLDLVFAEMRRLLRKGGRLVIADVAVDTAPARYLNGFVAQNNPLGHDGRFFDAAVPDLLERSGLTVQADGMVDVPWTFSSILQGGEFCRSLFGTTSLKAEDVADQLSKEIGFESRSDDVQLLWKLRRIVCDAA